MAVCRAKSFCRPCSVRWRVFISSAARAAPDGARRLFCVFRAFARPGLFCFHYIRHGSIRTLHFGHGVDRQDVLIIPKSRYGGRLRTLGTRCPCYGPALLGSAFATSFQRALRFSVCPSRGISPSLAASGRNSGGREIKKGAGTNNGPRAVDPAAWTADHGSWTADCQDGTSLSLQRGSFAATTRARPAQARRRSVHPSIFGATIRRDKAYGECKGGTPVHECTNGQTNQAAAGAEEEERQRRLDDETKSAAALSFLSGVSGMRV